MKYIMIVDTEKYDEDLIKKMMYAGAAYDPHYDLTVELVKEVSQFQEDVVKLAVAYIQ